MTKKRSIRALQRFPRYGVSRKGVVYRLTKRGSDEPLLIPRPLVAIEHKTLPYLVVSLYAAGNGRVPAVCYVHELVAETYLGPRPAGADIHHRNKDKRDNRAKNLRYVTRTEHAAEHRSELRRKLSDEDVREIRRRIAALPPLNARRRPGYAGDSLKRIAAEKGVHRESVRHIQDGQVYVWLEAA